MITRSKFVENAKKYLGKPYVWGGESEKEGGYDCSGFLYNVLKDSGFNVYRRTARDYYRKFADKEVSIIGIKQGQLLFFGTSKLAIKHVAIAVDSDRMIESLGSSKNTITNKGKGVCINPIKRRGDLIAVVDLFSDVSIYYPKYTGSSMRIDIVFKAIGAPYGSVNVRKNVAFANGFIAYSGTLRENLALIKLAKAGELRR